MLWGTIETTLISEVKRITGLTSVQWEGQKSPSGWVNDCYAELALISLVAIGEDELRAECVDPATISYTVFGLRRFVIQIRIDSLSQSLPLTGLAKAEVLAATLKRCPTACDNIAAAELAVSQIRPLRVADYCDCDGRKRSAVLFEVAFNTSSIVDCADVPTVAKVEYGHTITREDGTPAVDGVHVIIPGP